MLSRMVDERMYDVFDFVPRGVSIKTWASHKEMADAYYSSCSLKFSSLREKLHRKVVLLERDQLTQLMLCTQPLLRPL